MQHSAAILYESPGHKIVTWAAETVEGAIEMCGQDVIICSVSNLLVLQRVCRISSTGGPQVRWLQPVFS